MPLNQLAMSTSKQCIHSAPKKILRATKQEQKTQKNARTIKAKSSLLQNFDIIG